MQLKLKFLVGDKERQNQRHDALEYPNSERISLLQRGSMQDRINISLR